MNGRRFGNEFTPSSSACFSFSLSATFRSLSLPLPRLSFFVFHSLSYFASLLSLPCVRTRGLHQVCLSPAAREGDVTALSARPRRRSATCTAISPRIEPPSRHHVATVVDLRDSSRIFCLKKTRRPPRSLPLTFAGVSEFIGPPEIFNALGCRGSGPLVLSHFVAGRGH